jgi:RNA polymerase sigma-70 factor (ECF subfamily)
MSVLTPVLDLVCTPADDIASDSDLLRRALRGETDAFCELVRPHESRLLRQAAVLTREPALAEDLAQETLFEAWKNLARFNGQCRLFTWLYAIMLACHSKMLRRIKRRPFALSELFGRDKESAEYVLENLADQAHGPDSSAQRAETATLVRTCIDRLPERSRAVVYFRFYAEASLEEIAIALGCSIGTVKSRLFYALEKLRAMNIQAEDH